MDIALTDTERPTARALTTAEAPTTTSPITTAPITTSLTRRDRAILKAVADGRAELVYGAEPDLLLDGRCCCDQMAAHRLARAGLIAPLAIAPVGQRVPARLTAAGTAQLSA
jgi:hypothetical protein